MDTHRPHSILHRRNLVHLTAFFLSSLVVCLGFAVSAARPGQDGAAAPPQDERVFKNEIPEHVPVRVKLKSGKSFKDLKNKGWARELEMEVKNTGSKPIYYLHVVLVMPDVRVGGYPLSMRTTYGRKALGLPETPVRPDDVPVLLSGQSLTVKLPESQARAYERARGLEGRPDPTIVEFEMQAVKFGDGTSFRGRAGKEWHEAKEKETTPGGGVGRRDHIRVDTPARTGISYPRFGVAYPFMRASLAGLTQRPVVLSLGADQETSSLIRLRQPAASDDFNFTRAPDLPEALSQFRFSHGP